MAYYNEEGCPNGWILNGTFCYLAVSGNATYREAQSDCETYGAGLASIWTVDEWDIIQSLQVQC